MATLVIVPCGRAKVWAKDPHAGPTPARDAYVGTPFKVNRQYAQLFSDAWMILSAKYGFLAPTDLIPGPYNVSFKAKCTAPIRVDRLVDQIRERQLDLRSVNDQ